MGAPISAGWHPDPTGRAELRWFDGTHWTDDVAADGVASREAPPPPGPPPSGPPPGPPPSGPPPGPPPSGPPPGPPPQPPPPQPPPPPPGTWAGAGTGAVTLERTDYLRVARVPALVGKAYELSDASGATIGRATRHHQTVQLTGGTGTGFLDLARRGREVHVAHPGGLPWGSVTREKKPRMRPVLTLATHAGVLATAQATSATVTELLVAVPDGRNVARLSRSARVLSGPVLTVELQPHLGDPLHSLLLALPNAVLLLFDDFDHPRAESFS